MDTEASYAFEEYLNCELFDVHRWSNYPEVLNIRKQLLNELGFKGSKKEVNHVTVILLNLYHAYCLDPEKWVLFSRGRNDYNQGTRFNKLFIKYDNMIKTVDGLLALGYIEQAKGFQDRKTGKAFGSRMKATSKLIELVEQENRVTFEMIGQWQDDELIVLRNADGVDIDYKDTAEIKRMRTILEDYNALLTKTYIDIHFEPADIQTRIDKRRKKKEKKTGKSKDYRLNICLANKKVKRVFNNSTFNQGGRFFGGWWQNIPSELRPRIILNSNYTVEIDYSGQHIYLLYAMKGINFADLDKEPYIYPKDNDPDELRPILKVLLLAAINSKTDVECIKAVQFEVNMNRDEFPDDIPDLNKVYKTFKEYHSDIADLFGSKLGLKLQRCDSDIAEDIVRVMTENQIPVLVVHDSFIVPKGEEQFLEETMKIVFNRHATKLGLPEAVALWFKPTVSNTPISMKTKDITEEQTELFTQEDIISELAGRLDSPQARRFIRYKENQDPTTNMTIKVFNKDITEVGYDLKEYAFTKEDFLDEEFTDDEL